MSWSSKNLGNVDSLSGANVDFVLTRSKGWKALMSQEQAYMQRDKVRQRKQNIRNDVRIQDKLWVNDLRWVMVSIKALEGFSVVESSVKVNILLSSFRRMNPGPFQGYWIDLFFHAPPSQLRFVKLLKRAKQWQWTHASNLILNNNKPYFQLILVIKKNRKYMQDILSSQTLSETNRKTYTPPVPAWLCHSVNLEQVMVDEDERKRSSSVNNSPSSALLTMLAVSHSDQKVCCCSHGINIETLLKQSEWK